MEIEEAARSSGQPLPWVLALQAWRMVTRVLQEIVAKDRLSCRRRRTHCCLQEDWAP